MTYQSSKTFGNERGLSCCFRQWKATHSHCSLLHGYSLGFKLVFESSTLDSRNWVYDFGAFKEFKEWLDYMFDHTVLVAKDDPNFSDFIELSNFFKPELLNTQDSSKRCKAHERGAIIDMRVVESVGCEAFAKLAYSKMNQILGTQKIKSNCGSNVILKSVEVFEHGANSATYKVD